MAKSDSRQLYLLESPPVGGLQYACDCSDAFRLSLSLLAFHSSMVGVESECRF
jgi:hypothetical protein